MAAPKNERLEEALIEALLAERHRQRLTQEGLATRLGWSSRNVWRIENFQRPLYVRELSEWCTALECTVFDLLSRAPARDKRAMGLDRVIQRDE